jgi:hypothetical protein
LEQSDGYQGEALRRLRSSKSKQSVLFLRLAVEGWPCWFRRAQSAAIPPLVEFFLSLPKGLSDPARTLPDPCYIRPASIPASAQSRWDDRLPAPGPDTDDPMVYQTRKVTPLSPLSKGSPNWACPSSPQADDFLHWADLHTTDYHSGQIGCIYSHKLKIQQPGEMGPWQGQSLKCPKFNPKVQNEGRCELSY